MQPPTSYLFVYGIAVFLLNKSASLFQLAWANVTGRSLLFVEHSISLGPESAAVVSGWMWGVVKAGHTHTQHKTSVPWTHMSEMKGSEDALALTNRSHHCATRTDVQFTQQEMVGEELRHLLREKSPKKAGIRLQKIRKNVFSKDTFQKRRGSGDKSRRNEAKASVTVRWSHHEPNVYRKYMSSWICPSSFLYRIKKSVVLNQLN